MNLEKQTLIFQEGKLIEVCGPREPDIFFNRQQLDIIKESIQQGKIKEGYIIQLLGENAIAVGELDRG